MGSTGGDVVSGRPAVMRSLIADIVTMRQRMQWMLNPKRGMTFLVMRFSRLSVHSVTLNKMFDKNALDVGCTWENTSVGFASFMMMIYPNCNTIVMDVVYVELGDRRISSTATNVAAAIQFY